MTTEERPQSGEGVALADMSGTPGLHDLIVEQLVPRWCRADGRIVDLGAGSGALASRLKSSGYDVLAAEWNRDGFHADVPFVQVDLNGPDFAEHIGPGKFSLVVSTEVMEHLESPIGFLRGVGELLAPAGVAVITTPNVDSVPARVRFLLTDAIRMLDANGEPTHITPVFRDLLHRVWLPRAGLRLMEHNVFPARSWAHTRGRSRWAFRIIAELTRGGIAYGDHHVLVLSRS